MNKFMVKKPFGISYFTFEIPIQNLLTHAKIYVKNKGSILMSSLNHKYRNNPSSATFAQVNCQIKTHRNWYNEGWWHASFVVFLTLQIIKVYVWNEVLSKFDVVFIIE